MKGQLWEPCPVCGEEPVCVDCGYCARHCKCADDRKAHKLARRINETCPGFLDGYVKHLEDGAREH